MFCSERKFKTKRICYVQNIHPIYNNNDMSLMSEHQVAHLYYYYSVNIIYLWRLSINVMIWPLISRPAICWLYFLHITLAISEGLIQGEHNNDNIQGDQRWLNICHIAPNKINYSFMCTTCLWAPMILLSMISFKLQL